MNKDFRHILAVQAYLMSSSDGMLNGERYEVQDPLPRC